MFIFKDSELIKFPGGLMVRVLGFHCSGQGSVPGGGTEIVQSKKRKEDKEWKKNNSIKKKSGLGSFIDRNSPDQKLNLHKTS